VLLLQRSDFEHISVTRWLLRTVNYKNEVSACLDVSDFQQQ